MSVLDVSDFIKNWDSSILAKDLPWILTSNCEAHISILQKDLGDEYRWQGNSAIHKTAVIEAGAVLKGAIIISAGCFVGAGAYLRGGVYLGENCSLGPGCEVKSSFILNDSALAHFNFVGDSLLGERVNIEAGAIIANHRNELDGCNITVRYAGKTFDTGVNKFGAVIGDDCKIGANAVIAPGALITPNTRVPRLTLIDQL